MQRDPKCIGISMESAGSIIGSNIESVQIVFMRLYSKHYKAHIQIRH